MSANPNDFSQSAGETDIEQLTRVVEKLQKAFQELTQTTDKLSKTAMVDMMKATISFMKKEKEAQEQKLKASTENINKINQMTIKGTIDTIKRHQQLSAALGLLQTKIQGVQSKFAMEASQKAIDIAERKKQKDASHAQSMELQEQHQQNVKANIRLRHSLTGVTTSLSLFTGLLRNGVTVGAVFGTSINNIQNALRRQKELVEINNNLANEQAKLATAKAATPADTQLISAIEKLIKKLEDDRKQTTSGVGAGTAGLLGNKGMGFLSTIADFASTHKTGIILGAAVGGTLLMVLKKAFDASPMFGQIVKLLDFGFRLILRPIGDFFGFILKPIVILLLRKFIIPFYQKFLPQFQEWGTTIGNFIASIDPATLGVVIAGVVATALAGSLAGISLAIKGLCGCMAGRGGGLGGGKGGGGGLGGGILASAVAALTALVAKIKNGAKSIITFMTDIITKIKSGVKLVTDFITDVGTKIKSGIKSITDFITDIGTKIKSGIKSVTDFIDEIGTKIKSGIKSVTDFISDIGTKIKSGLKSLTDFIDEIGTKMVGGLKSFITKAEDFGKTAYETLKNTISKVLEIGGKIAGNIIDSIGNTLKWVADGMKSTLGASLKFFTKLTDFIGNKASNLINSITGKLGGSTGGKVAGTVAKMGLKTATRAIPIVGWSLLAVDMLGSVLKQFDPKSYEAINKGATSIGIPEWLLDFIGFGKESTFEQVKGMFEGLADEQSKNTKVEGHAHGGMISEPILGVGKSGKKYMFGERGNEFITPNGSRSSQNGNIVVNINIDKMSSSREDINELRRVVLNIMQDVNQKRGRI